jgi:DNA repair protein RadA/Sms
VDSIQTTYLDELTSAAGSISQVRECAARMQTLSKSSGVAVMLVGHVTKSGALAGPKVLEHMVDTVLYLEGDRFHTYRLLRSVKNRFGATSEVGVFEMRGDGMVEVANPSEAFLAERLTAAPGSAIAVTMEGTRPLLVEVQALASTTSFGLPRRTPNGVDMNRLLLLVAVLQKRIGLKLGDQDVFVNVIGGLRIGEPAADLAIAMAMTSSARYACRARPPLSAKSAFGRAARRQLPPRGSTSEQVGFGAALSPRASASPHRKRASGLDVIGARSLGEAIDIALNKGR